MIYVPNPIRSHLPTVQHNTQMIKKIPNADRGANLERSPGSLRTEQTLRKRRESETGRNTAVSP